MVTHEDAIIKYTYSTKRVSVIRSSYHYLRLRGLLLLASNKLLAADVLSHQLRLFDVDRDTAMDICSGDEGITDGTLKTCQLSSPRAMVAIGNKIYVGRDKRITVIKGEQIRNLRFRGYDHLTFAISLFRRLDTI